MDERRRLAAPLIGLGAAAAAHALSVSGGHAWVARTLVLLSALAALPDWPRETEERLAPVSPPAGARPWPSREALATTVALVVASLILFTSLGTVPWVVSAAEASFGLDHPRLVSTFAHRLDPLLVIRGLSALLTLVALAAFFRLLMDVCGPALALLGTWLALSCWQVGLQGRLGLGASALAALAACSVLLSVRALRAGSPRAALGAGLVAGVACVLATPAPWVALLVPVQLVTLGSTVAPGVLTAALASYGGGLALGLSILFGLTRLGAGLLGAVAPAAEGSIAELLALEPVTAALLPMALLSLFHSRERRLRLVLLPWILWVLAVMFFSGARPAQLGTAFLLPAHAAVAALLLRLLRAFRTRVGSSLTTVAFVLVLVVMAAGNARRVKDAVSATASRDGQMSEIARFLAEAPPLAAVRLVPGGVKAEAPQFRLLAPHQKVLAWDGWPAGPMPSRQVTLVVATGPGIPVLEELEAATGTRRVRYGRAPFGFGTLLLGGGDEVSLPPVSPPASAPGLFEASQLLAAASPGANGGDVVFALDRDPSTRWTTEHPQRAGDWFQVELPVPAAVKEVVLDTLASPGDYPRGLTVLASDGGPFRVLPVEPVVSPLTRVAFDPPVKCRVLRLVQTGEAPTSFWSIHELRVMGTAAGDPPQWRPVDPSRLRVSSSRNPAAIRRAFDEDLQTRWDTQAAQAGGEKLEVELPVAGKLAEVRLDASKSPRDYPRGLRVLVSDDGRSFRHVAAVNFGAPRMRVPIDPPTPCRFVRIEQTGSDPFYFWSLHEASLWGEFPGAEGEAAGGPASAPLARSAPRLLDLDPLSLRCGSPGRCPELSAGRSAAPAPRHVLRTSSFRPQARHLLGNATDGDPRTRWDSGGPQTGGEWFQVDFPQPGVLTELTLDNSGSPSDSPRRLQISVSGDGRLFEPVALVEGRSPLLRIPIEPPVRCRSVRLEQTARDATFYWSIHELTPVGHFAEVERSWRPRGAHLAALLVLAGLVPLALVLGRRRPDLRRAGRAALRGQIEWVRSKLRTHPRRALVLGLGWTLAAATAIAVASGRDGVWPFLTWIGSLVLALAPLAPGGQERPRRLAAADVLLLALLLGVGGFYRLHRIQEQPTGLWIDEVATARNALGLAAHRPFAPFGTTTLLQGDIRTSNLYLYACWVVMRMSSVTVLGVKLLSILPGILAAPCLYLLARRFLSRASAAGAAGLLAVSLWHVTLSRWGWDEVLVTTLAIVGFAKLWDAAEDLSAWSHAISGVVFGLALYTYLSARLALAAAVLFLAARLALDRDRRRLRGVAWFLAGVILASLPLLVHWTRNPGEFRARVNELSIVPRVLGGEVETLLNNLESHLLMFHVSGDRNPRHNLPGLPMLDAPAGFLFLVGLVLAVARWRRSESLLCLLWLFVGLLGGVLSDPVEAPQAYRTGLVAPACYLLASLGLEAIGRFAGFPRGRAAVARALLAVSLVAVSGYLTYRSYFEGRARSAECWGSVYDGAHSAYTSRLAQRLSDRGVPVLLDASVGWAALHFEIDEIVRRRRPDARIKWTQAETLSDADLAGTVMLVLPQRWKSAPPHLAALPRLELTNPFGEPIVTAVSRDGALLKTVLATQASHPR